MVLEEGVLAKVPQEGLAAVVRAEPGRVEVVEAGARGWIEIGGPLDATTGGGAAVLELRRRREHWSCRRGGIGQRCVSGRLGCRLELRGGLGWRS